FGAHVVDLVHRVLAGATASAVVAMDQVKRPRWHERNSERSTTPTFSAHWLRHAHANRVLDIFRAVSKGVSAGVSRQHRRAAHALGKPLRLLAGWRTETGRHTFVTLVVAHRISLSCAKGNALSGDVSCRNWSSRSN